MEHRTRSEVLHEALRAHFGEDVYMPTNDERRRLVAALDDAAEAPERSRDWDQVRTHFRVEQ